MNPHCNSLSETFCKVFMKSGSFQNVSGATAIAFFAFKTPNFAEIALQKLERKRINLTGKKHQTYCE